MTAREVPEIRILEGDIKHHPGQKPSITSFIVTNKVDSAQLTMCITLILFV